MTSHPPLQQCLKCLRTSAATGDDADASTAATPDPAAPLAPPSFTAPLLYVSTHNCERLFCAECIRSHVEAAVATGQPGPCFALPCLLPNCPKDASSSQLSLGDASSSQPTPADLESLSSILSPTLMASFAALYQRGRAAREGGVRTRRTPTTLPLGGPADCPCCGMLHASTPEIGQADCQEASAAPSATPTPPAASPRASEHASASAAATTDHAGESTRRGRLAVQCSACGLDFCCACCLPTHNHDAGVCETERLRRSRLPAAQPGVSAAAGAAAAAAPAAASEQASPPQPAAPPAASSSSSSKAANSTTKPKKSRSRRKNIKHVLEIPTPVMNQFFGILLIGKRHNVYVHIDDAYCASSLEYPFPEPTVRVVLTARAKRRATQRNIDSATAEFARRIRQIEKKLAAPPTKPTRARPRIPYRALPAGTYAPTGRVIHAMSEEQFATRKCIYRKTTRKPEAAAGGSIRLMPSASGSLVVKKPRNPPRQAKRRVLVRG